MVFALRIHRGHTDEEKKALVGEEIYQRIACVDSNPTEVLHLGTTKRGTPVDIFRHVAQADRRILVGNIESHYFAGYSGGAKAIMSGVSTRAAIQANHRRMVEESAHAGNINRL
ncbi:MAG: lactate racemase domain-containing protein [Desulfitobacteriaceae bacterium]